MEQTRPDLRQEDAIILRDRLAFDRTVLANERTLLAFIRTSIGSFGAGAALLKFFEMPWVHTVGVALTVCAPLFLIAGVGAYFRTHRRIKRYHPDL